MRPVDHLERIKGLLLSGQIDYDTAKQSAQTHLNKMNEKAKEVAKKHNRKHNPFNFSSFMR